MDKYPILKKWGARLREIRIANGYRKQGDLAKAMIKAGYTTITQSAISRAENGGLEKPQEEMAEYFIKHHPGPGVTKEEIFKIPIDWRQKYYELLEKTKNQASQDRINELERMVERLSLEITRLKNNKEN